MRRLAPSFFFSFAEGVRVSQEWDEVVHEVRLMVKRLDAFRDDLRAAAAGGELTDEQCGSAIYIAGLSSAAALCLLHLQLHAEATSAAEEKGDTEQ